MASPIVGIRIPPDLLKQIDDRAIEGKSRTDVILELIRSGLTQPEQEPERDRLTAFDDRLTVLEDIVQQTLDRRLRVLEDLVRQTLDRRSTDIGASVKRASNDRRTEGEVGVKQSLDNRLTESEASVKQALNKRQTSIWKVAPQNYGELPPDANNGLSQTALCEFYGLSWRNVKRNAAAAGFDDMEAYFQQMTGITWTQEKSGMTKLYFPKD